MKLKIGIETEDIGEVDIIQLSKGKDDNWRLYLTKGKKTRHFNLNKVLKNQIIEPESIEVFVATEGRTLLSSEVTAKS